MSPIRIAIAFATFSLLGFAQIATSGGYATARPVVPTVMPEDPVNAAPKSVGEVAREYHRNVNVQGKVFTNADLAALHPAGEETFPQSESMNLQSGTNETTTNTMGGNASDLPQSDQAADTFDSSGKPSAGH